MEASTSHNTVDPRGLLQGLKKVALSGTLKMQSSTAVALSALPYVNEYWTIKANVMYKTRPTETRHLGTVLGCDILDAMK
jgi:arginine utilization protein RocB